MKASLQPEPSTALAPRTRRIISAWHRGESGGSYQEFHDLLAPGFDYFSHAFIGAKHGAEARETLNALLAARKRHPGTLTFRDILCFEQGDYGIVRYHSAGIVAGPSRTRYDGPAVILFHYAGDRIRGFEESLGYFDPSWSLPRTPSQIQQNVKRT